MGTGQRPDSSTSFAPSFRTRDSRVFSDDHDIDRNPDLLANQRLLAEGYMNSNDPYHDHPSPAYNQTFSQATLTSTNYNNNYGNEKSGMSLYDRPVSSHSHQSWCTCDDDHGHSQGSKPFDTDVEGQREPATPTPFLSGEEKKAAAGLGAGASGGPGGDKKGPGGPGGPGGKGPGGPGGPPGGPPGLPPFPPGFPDENKVSDNSHPRHRNLLTYSRSLLMDRMILSTLRTGHPRRSGPPRHVLPVSHSFHLWPHR